MKTKEISIEKFNKLQNCEVWSTHKQEWLCGFKLLRKGKTWSTVLSLSNYGILRTYWSKNNVKLLNSKITK